MNWIQAVLLGMVQGLTEYLPVSSSGHLVLGQHLFGLTEPELVFDIGVHVGTLVAVLIYFRQDLTRMVRKGFTFLADLIRRRASLGSIWSDPDLRLIALICIGSVPTALMGLYFKDMAEQLFSSVRLVGFSLIATGVLLTITRWCRPTDRDVLGLKVRDALLIGVVQGLAILPGISRSGATISTGLYLGVGRSTAARFSFLLSIPAILGAALLGAKDLHATGSVSGGVLLAGVVVSGVFGYLALKFLIYIVDRGQLHLFAPYCLLVGVLALILG